jgi:hypothetical protein
MELPVDAIRQGDRELDTHGMSWDELAVQGAALWNDKSLSGTGATSCSTCHSGDGTAMMNASFAEPYPHPVAMAKDRAGLDQVTAAEMVQLCMAIPMAAEPLDYGSVELGRATPEDVRSVGDGWDEPVCGEPVRGQPVRRQPVRGEPVRGEPVRRQSLRSTTAL